MNGNLFALPADVGGGGEVTETILHGSGCRIERIVSAGQRSPDGFWYDQEEDEWVLLLQGEAELAFEGGKRMSLRAGDQVFLPARLRHRVERTSINPPCIWLCLYGNLKFGNEGNGK